MAESAAAWLLNGRLYARWAQGRRPWAPFLSRARVCRVCGEAKKVKSKKRTERLGKGAVQHRDLGPGDQLELPHAPMGSGTSRSRSHWLEGLQVSLLFEEHDIPTLLCHSAHRIAAGGTGLQIRTTPPGFVDTPYLPGLGRGGPGSLSGWAWPWQNGATTTASRTAVLCWSGRDRAFVRRQLIHPSGFAMVLPQNSFSACRCWLRCGRVMQAAAKNNCCRTFLASGRRFVRWWYPRGAENRRRVQCFGCKVIGLGGGTRGVGQQAICGAR